MWRGGLSTSWQFTRSPPGTLPEWVAGLSNVHPGAASDVGLRRHRVVAVSPHFDDVALSMAGVLARSTGPIAIVTAHGGQPPLGSRVTDWDLDCGFVSADEAYHRRLAEDACACAMLGADQVVLPNADGPYRDGAPLRMLDEMLASLPPGADLYLPLGVNQPDHAKVRDQALAALSGRSDIRPLLYADLPYAAVVPGWGHGDDGTALARDPVAGKPLRDLALTRSLRLACSLAVDGGLWQAKRDAVLCYASQLGPVGVMDEVAGTGPLLGPGGPLRYEMIWQVCPEDGDGKGRGEVVHHL